MDNVMEVLSKFKDNLDGIIADCKSKIDDIKKEKEFIQVLGDVVNYSKSDYLLLPFYDESILSTVFERVFPLSSAEINKIKAAKYLIEASKSVDKDHFLQYNNAVKDVKSINNKLSKFYEKLLADNKLENEENDINLKIENYSKIYDSISDEGFSGLIDDVDLFEEVIKSCDLSNDEINVILNIAIKDNLKFLDSNGVMSEMVNDDIIDMKEQNNVFQDSINDLSSLLVDEQEEVMKLRNYLVDLLSNIIHDKLKLLADTKNDMKKIDEYKRIEDLFSDVNNIVNVSDDELRNVLLDVTDSDTVDGIISNVDMIRIVLNGKNSGLDLSLDDSQEDLIKGVYEIVNNYRLDLENKNSEVKEYLEDFISKCQGLSAEIGTGVVRDIDTLDEIFSENDVSLDDVINAKFEILRNNSKNYNLDLEGKVKEEVDLRIILKKIDVEIDSYSEIEKKLLITYGNIESIKSLIDFIFDNGLKFSNNSLFLVMLFSNVSILSSILDISKTYEMSMEDLFKIPGVFISSNTKDLISQVIDENCNDSDFYIIENLKYIGSYHETFVDNISLMESSNRNVSECFKNNILSLIVPDLSKNITILSDMQLSNRDFSVVVINPYLATSRSSFVECGLSEYLNSNPLRLTTSYYRLKNIASNIVSARKNGKIIFRSLSDKKNYWLAKNITRNDNDSEVV